jgi:hypothetical protein
LIENNLEVRGGYVQHGKEEKKDSKSGSGDKKSSSDEKAANLSISKKTQNIKKGKGKKTRQKS